MRLKSFTGRSLPDAMHRVREALGPDAVILSSQPADDGKAIRVTAAIEDSPLEDLSVELAPGAASLEDIDEALGYHRMPPDLHDRLLGAVAERPARDQPRALAGALERLFGFEPPPEGPVPRPLMLVGPPGAGKTASAAKLCARARLAGADATLITMDTVKSGGLAQVSQFAEALGAHLQQAPDVGALAEAVERCPPDHMAVIDTVGAKPFDDEEIDCLELAAQAAGAEPVLVLAAGGDTADSAEAAAAFARIGARRIIVTKLDVSRRFGGLLSAAQAGRLAFLAASASPHIADRLLLLDQVALARLLLLADPRRRQTAMFKESA